MPREAQRELDERVHRTQFRDEKFVESFVGRPRRKTRHPKQSPISFQPPGTLSISNENFATARKLQGHTHSVDDLPGNTHYTPINLSNSDSRNLSGPHGRVELPSQLPLHLDALNSRSPSRYPSTSEQLWDTSTSAIHTLGERPTTRRNEDQSASMHGVALLPWGRLQQLEHSRLNQPRQSPRHLPEHELVYNPLQTPDITELDTNGTETESDASDIEENNYRPIRQGVENMNDTYNLDNTRPDIIALPNRTVDGDITEYLLGMAIFTETKGITRNLFGIYRALEAINDNSNEESLPLSLSTLKKYGAARLPIPDLKIARVPVLMSKQPTKTSTSFAQLPYLDPRTLVCMILNAKLSNYYGMAEIVDSPSELWHANCWGSSIRTSSGQYAKYPSGEPIIPSDFVIFKKANDLNSESTGRVIFFGRDKRDTSPSYERVVLRIQQVQPLDVANEYVLLEDHVFEITESQILGQNHRMRILRTFEDPDGLTTQFVTQVYNTVSGQYRSTDKLHALRGELEIEHYGREHLVSLVRSKGVTSIPLICFIDKFGLYRNMYRSLCGVYLTPANFSLVERQKIRSIYPVALGPHGSTLRDVIESIKLPFQDLERGCRMEVKGETVQVCAQILVYTGDMPQQQEAAGFMSPRANLSCRMCLADKSNRDDMDYDVVSNGRYHHETLFIRRNIDAMTYLKDRVNRYAELGMASEPAALQLMSPCLDLLWSTPNDPAHSEFYGIFRKAVNCLCKEILTPKGLSEFTREFNTLPYPPGWCRIQSPQKHRGSWDMSECARASVLVPILLWRWPLQSVHIKPKYRARLKQNCGGGESFSACAFIIETFVQLARSNCLTAATKMSVESRRNPENIIINARRNFILLMSASESKPTGKLRKCGKSKKNHKRAFVQEATESDTAVSQTSGSTYYTQTVPNATLLSILKNRTIGSGEEVEAVEEKMAALPNTHVAKHFSAILAEYGLIWNVNVLAGEHFHKMFKGYATAINHHEPAVQLLQKAAVKLATRLVLHGAFLQVDPHLSAVISSLQARCPALFDDILDIDGLDEDDEGDSHNLGDKRSVIGDHLHLRPRVSIRIPARSILSWQMPLTMASVSMDDPFLKALTQAMRSSYDIRATTLSQKPLFWYKKLTFTDRVSTVRLSALVGQYVVLNNGGIVKINWIFTHAFPHRDHERRVFLIVTKLLRHCHDDQILGLPLYRLGEDTAEMIGLSDVTACLPYLVPVKGEDNLLLYCTWQVKFR